MSARARSNIGAVLTIAAAFVPGPWSAALLIAGSYLSYTGRKKLEQEAQRRARAARDRQAVTVTASGTFEPLLMVWGKTRVGGLKCVLGTENGPDMANQYVYMGVAHSAAHAGGCEGIGDVWIDDTRIPAADIDVNGDVTAGVFAGLVKITHYRGTGTQAADASLIAAGLDYTTAYRRGVAWTLFRFKRPLDSEAFRKAFKYGEPNPSVELKGMRVYDPRLDSTNGGSGAHRYSDPTTWEWVNGGSEIGRNPILQDATRSIMNRLDGGEGVPPERIIWSTVAAAASKCEETGMYTDGAQKRFQSDGAFSSQDDPDVKMATILDACQGKRIELGSQFAYYAGCWATETFTIDDTWLASDDFEYQILSPIESGWNAVRTSFSDRSADYKTVEAPPYTNAAYELEDGGYQNFKDLTLHMVSHHQQAQYCSQIIGKRSRMQKVLALRLNGKGFDIQPWETGIVNLTINGHSLAALRWRIAHWQPAGNNVDVVLEQDASSVWDVEAFSAYIAGDPPVVGDEVGPAPANLTATAVSDGIHLKWDLPPEYPFMRMRIERSPDGVGSWALISTVAASQPWFIDPVLDGSTYYYRVNGSSRTGSPSLYSAIVSATAKQGADAASAKVSNAGFELGDVSWDKDGGAWSIVKDGTQRTGAWCGKLTGTGASISKKLRNAKQVPCAPGELVSVAGFLKSTASATGTGAIEISWLDSAGAELSVTAGNAITPGTTYRRSKAQGSAPASTAYVRVQFAVSAFNSAASEAWRVDDSSLEMFIDNIDHVPDGSTYGRPKQTALTSGEVDLSKAGVIQKSADYITESGSRKWAAESGADVTSGKSLTVLIDRTLGNIADDATYGRTKLTALTSGEVDLSKAGVLNKTADQIAETGGRKWAAESGADVTAGKSIDVLEDVKTTAQFFTFTQTITAVGSSTITIPEGAKLLVIRAWGPGGGGARTSLEGTAIGGGGGGAGVKKSVLIKSTDWGQTISYSITAGGLGRTSTTGNGLASTATTVTSSGLSFTNLNLSAGSGQGGTTAAGGAGGTASGGDTNTSGFSGIFSASSEGGWSAAIDSISGVGGYEDSSGSAGDQPLQPEQPGGGGAGNGAGDGQNGAPGMVTFTWSG